MKVASKLFTQTIDLNETPICSLVIENPNLFYRLVTGLISDADFDLLVFSVNNEPVSIEKYTEITTDLFNLDFGSKKIENLLLRKVRQEFEFPDAREEFNKIRNELSQLLDKVLLDFDFPIVYTKDFDVGDLLKTFSLKISQQFYDKTSMFLEYFKIVNEIKNVNIFFTINIKSIFTSEEFDAFQKECKYQKYCLIDIENAVFPYKAENEFSIIIDKDLCEL